MKIAVVTFANNGYSELINRQQTEFKKYSNCDYFHFSNFEEINSPALRSFVNPHLRSVFNIIPVSTGSVSFPKGNIPVGEGSFGKQTEGSDKAQIDYDVTVVNKVLQFIAGYVKVSRQMVDDLPFLNAYLQQSLIDRSEEAAQGFEKGFADEQSYYAELQAQLDSY